MIPYQQIFENNRKWVEGKLAGDSRTISKSWPGSNPRTISTSAVQTAGSPPRDHGTGAGRGVRPSQRRQPGHQQPDSNINAVIQYAVEHLEIKHIIVCGHYGCGGVKAALNPMDMGQLNSWLQTLRDVYRIHQGELSAIEDKREKFDRLVELNVIEQCVNVLKIDHVQKSWFQAGIRSCMPGSTTCTTGC